ncbi:MAG TPA: response regulator [Burkholderiales bacterium]|nr:response regulator [Burkholderiales bacterium]
MGTPKARRRILIVDDEEAMRLLLAKIVRQDLDAEVTLAGTCEAALRFARENSYDAILLDLLMPGIGGAELLKRIRAESASRSAPVVVVSVLANSSDTKALGADAILSKPVDRAALVAALRAQFRD